MAAYSAKTRAESIYFRDKSHRKNYAEHPLNPGCCADEGYTLKAQLDSGAEYMSFIDSRQEFILRITYFTNLGDQFYLVIDVIGYSFLCMFFTGSQAEQYVYFCPA